MSPEFAVAILKQTMFQAITLAAPVLSVLKARAPAAEIDALVYDDTAPMLEGHPALAQLHLVGRRWKEHGVLRRIAAERRLYGALRERGYDLKKATREPLKGGRPALEDGVAPRDLGQAQEPNVEAAADHRPKHH